MSVGLANHDFYAALRLGYAPRQYARLDAPHGAGGHVSLADTAFETGLRLHARAIEIPLLAGAEAGVFVARGIGPTTTAQTQVVDWLAGYLGTGLAFNFDDHWRIAARVDGVLALRRPSFALDIDMNEHLTFHRPSLLSLRTYFTIELHLQ